MSNLCQVPDVTPLPPSQSVNSSAQEGSSTNQGYQRFLDVLNKGVDINLLDKVCNIYNAYNNFKSVLGCYTMVYCVVQHNTHVLTK